MSTLPRKPVEDGTQQPTAKPTEGGTRTSSSQHGGPPVLEWCQCEHRSHFFGRGESRTRSPKGLLSHKYGAQFPDVQAVRTTWGTFNLCKDCREDCHG